MNIPIYKLVKVCQRFNECRFSRAMLWYLIWLHSLGPRKLTEILAWTCQAKNKLGYDVLTKSCYNQYPAHYEHLRRKCLVRQRGTPEHLSAQAYPVPRGVRSAPSRADTWHYWVRRAAAHSRSDYRLQAEHMTCWETRVRRVGSFMTASTGVLLEPITGLKRFTHTPINMAASCLQALLPSKLLGV